jgi:hypothetical protein
MKTVLRQLRKIRKKRRYLFAFFVTMSALVGDLWCLARYRELGLTKYRRLYIRPRDVKLGFKSEWPSYHLGVVSSKWDELELVEVASAAGGTVKRCIRKIRDQESWNSVGELSAQLDGKTTNSQVQKVQGTYREQVRALDAIISEVTSNRRLRNRRQLGRPFFREWKGISIVMGSDGEKILLDGHHRFGICLALELEVIPVALVSVHRDFVLSGKWKHYRRGLTAGFNRDFGGRHYLSDSNADDHKKFLP